MGLRDKLRAIKKLLKDPQGWTEDHGPRMNGEYASQGKAAMDAERAARPEKPGEEPPSPKK